MHNVVARHRIARYRRVLIPLDGSRLAEDIIPYVLSLAEALYMDVVLVRVVPPVPAPLNTVSMARADHMRARMEAAHNYLADIAAGLWGRGVRVQTTVRSGKPITEICAAAREFAADLIAMATHKRSRHTQRSPSVAEGVLRRGDTPVFVMQMQRTVIETDGRGIRVNQGAVIGMRTRLHMFTTSSAVPRIVLALQRRWRVAAQAPT